MTLKSSDPRNALSQTRDATFPCGADIRARIPERGIMLRSLLAMYNASTASQSDTSKIINLIKENARYDRERRVVFPP